MITEQARTIREELNRFEQLRQQANETGRFQTRAEQLEGPAHELAGLLRIARICRARGIPIRAAKSIQSLHLARRSIKESLNGEESILNDMKNLLSLPMQNVINSLRSDLTLGWEKYIEQRRPGLDNETLRLLEQIPSFRAHIANIKASLRALDQKRHRLPQASSDFDEVDSNLETLSRAWQSVEGADIPQRVLAFLREAVNPGGSSLARLDDEMREWIANHNLTDSFRIVLRGQGF